MTDFDRMLSSYRRSDETAWCTNPECEIFDAGVTVDYEEENGMGTISPDDCYVCGHQLTLDPQRSGQ